MTSVRGERNSQAKLPMGTKRPFCERLLQATAEVCPGRNAMNAFSNNSRSFPINPRFLPK